MIRRAGSGTPRAAMARVAAGLVAALALGGTAGRAIDAAAAEGTPQVPFLRGVVPVGQAGELLDGTPFRSPMSVHYDAHQDEVFVADPGSGLAGIFDAAGVPKFAFSTGRGHEATAGIDTDVEGNIYTLAPAARRMRVFDYRGEALRDWLIGEVERIAAVPSGFRIGPDGRVYVLDGGGRRILVYTPEGELQRVIRGSARSGGRLQAPIDLAFGGDGSLYVADAAGTPVQVYDASGRFLRGWGKRDIGPADFSSTAGIAVDAWGLVFVVDTIRQDVKVFDTEGAFQYRFGGFGPRPGDLSYPADVAVSPDGRIYVVERVGRRLQIFRRPLRAPASSSAVPSPGPASPPAPATPAPPAS